MTVIDPPLHDSSAPPSWAQELLTWLVPLSSEESIPGDLLEEYREAVRPSRGQWRANLWYLRQVAGFLCRLTWMFVVLNAAALISAACAAAGIVCLSLPRLIDGVKQRRSRNRSPVETTVAVVNDEAKEAVDYFGALQVVGAAFVFGLGAARKLKR